LNLFGKLCGEACIPAELSGTRKAQGRCFRGQSVRRAAKERREGQGKAAYIGGNGQDWRER